jgi:hypothetical protein
MESESDEEEAERRSYYTQRERMITIRGLCEEAEAVLDEEEAVKESVWVECGEEMVRCLVSDGWGRGLAVVMMIRERRRKRVCCVLL